MAKAAATKYYISIDYNKQSISIFGRSTCVVMLHASTMYHGVSSN